MRKKSSGPASCVLRILKANREGMDSMQAMRPALRIESSSLGAVRDSRGAGHVAPSR